MYKFSYIWYQEGMKRNKIKPLPSLPIFFRHVLRSVAIGFIILVFSLLIGMWGYRYFENMRWIDAFKNASMILSGMGPIDPIRTEGGKIFAGTYAIFSGVIFLIVIGVIIAPLAHRFLHKFILNQYDQKG